MKPITITVANYRNIPFGNPIEFQLKEGIQFILGLNNVGKSNLLKLFSELKWALSQNLENTLHFNPICFSGGMEFFDQIVNRHNNTKPIQITVASDECFGCAFEINISPSMPVDGDRHTNSFICTRKIIEPPGRHFEENVFKGAVRPVLDTMYIGAFRGVDFSGAGRSGDIPIGLEFVKQWSLWAGANKIEHRTKIKELVKELQSLFSFREFEIHVSDDKSTLLVTTDDGQFALNELGSGISHFIIVLGTAMIKNPAFILIDEPEIGLHPRMQEVFVRALAAKARYGLLASSHSVGLARSSAGWILSLTKSPDGTLRLEPFGQHYSPSISQSINELGYSQFVEIGGNNLLLVEGRTDIKAFQEILRKFGVETNFIIISIGGSEFVNGDASKIHDELSELKRLNAKSISVIFDSGRTSAGASLSPKFEGFKSCCEGLGFRVFPTDRHSTENYITQVAIDKVFGMGKYQALSHFENFNCVPNRWPKHKNWLLFREMSKDDLNGTELKAFIENELI